jgi:hypothetical protein
MADSSTNSNVSLEQLTTNVQSGLKGWRELVVSSRDVFLWKQQHHAGVIGGSVSAIFLLIWLLDATLLTTFSIIGIILTTADYAVPLVLSNLFDPANWNDKKEAEFNETCAALAAAWKSVLDLWAQWNEIKTTRPKLYSGLLLSILIVLAWIGNLFNNLFLTYLIVLFTALYPGLKTHGIIEKHLGKVIASIKEKVGDKLKQN